MQDDPVVAEVRRIREQFAARFNYDIDAIGKYARERDAAGDRKVVSLPPRPPTISVVKSRQAVIAPANQG